MSSCPTYLVIAESQYNHAHSLYIIAKEFLDLGEVPTAMRILGEAESVTFSAMRYYQKIMGTTRFTGENHKVNILLDKIKKLESRIQKLT